MTDVNVEHVRQALFNLQNVLLGLLFISFIGAFAGISYNIPLFFFGLYAFWTADNPMPIQIFGFFATLSVIIDIATMCVYTYPTGLLRFCLAMNIIVLIFKPLVIFLVLRLMSARGISLRGAGQWQSTPEAPATTYDQTAGPAYQQSYSTVGDSKTPNFYAPPPVEQTMQAGQPADGLTYQQM